jgi:hypothetical protein
MDVDAVICGLEGEGFVILFAAGACHLSASGCGLGAWSGEAGYDLGLWRAEMTDLRWQEDQG